MHHERVERRHELSQHTPRRLDACPFADHFTCHYFSTHFTSRRGCPPCIGSNSLLYTFYISQRPIYENSHLFCFLSIMATRINSLESCASSPVTSPSDQSRRSSTPEPAIPTYRGLSPKTKSLAKQVFNPENDFQTDSSSTYDDGLDWLMNMISHTEKLDTAELRRDSFAENVKAAHAMYDDIEGRASESSNSGKNKNSSGRRS